MTQKQSQSRWRTNWLKPGLLGGKQALRPADISDGLGRAMLAPLIFWRMPTTPPVAGGWSKDMVAGVCFSPHSSTRVAGGTDRVRDNSACIPSLSKLALTADITRLRGCVQASSRLKTSIGLEIN